MKKLILIAFLFISFVSFSQTIDVNKIKFRLTEYLLSCQSIAYSIYQETDIQRRVLLLSYGNKYYNIAYNEYTKLSNPELEPLSVDLRKVISISLETYATLFTDVSNFNDPNNALALSLLDVQYKKYFLPVLWEASESE